MENTSRNKRQLHQKSLNGGAELARSEATVRCLRTFISEETSVQESCIFHYSLACVCECVNTPAEAPIQGFKAASLEIEGQKLEFCLNTSLPSSTFRLLFFFYFFPPVCSPATT